MRLTLSRNRPTRNAFRAVAAAVTPPAGMLDDAPGQRLDRRLDRREAVGLSERLGVDEMPLVDLDEHALAAAREVRMAARQFAP